MLQVNIAQSNHGFSVFVFKNLVVVPGLVCWGLDDVLSD